MGILSGLSGLFRPQPDLRELSMGAVFGGDWTQDAPWTDISGDRALRVAAVFGAVRIIADGVSCLPWALWQKTGTGRTPIRLSDPEWFDWPDDRMSTFDWIHQGLVSLLLRGNAYALVWRRDDGSVREVDWLPAHAVSVQDIDLSAERRWPRYWVAGMGEVLDIRRPAAGATDSSTPLILHVPAFTLPGSVVGLNPVANFRAQFEMARNATDTAASYFADRGPIPGGILMSDTTLKQEQVTEAKERFKASVTPGDVGVLDKHWKFEKVTLDPADAQFLETIKASANQIAAIYGVDPRDIGGSEDSSLTYQTVEGNERKLAIRTLQPWTERFAQALYPLVNLARPAGTPRSFVAFDLNARAKPDALTWAQTQTERLENGTLTLDEARRDNGDPSLTQADIDAWQWRFKTSKSQSQSQSTSTSESTSTSTQEGQ